MKGRIGDKQRLLHIVDAISEIESYVNNVSFDFFARNSMMRFASIKQLEIIGEAANYLTSETRSKFSDIECRQIVGMRNILVHEYFGIDNNLIWQVIIFDLPALKIKVEAVLSTFID
jgi:uncharacterized protein with HEPN domain